MKKLLIAASFALALPTAAQAETTAEYCAALARYTLSVAEKRDEGYPPSAATQHLYEVVASSGRAVEDWRLQNMHAVIDRVYQAPHGAPTDEAAGVYLVCLEELAQ